MLASLGCQHPFCLITMSLAFPILLVCILYRNLFVHQVLTIHVGDSRVRGFEIGKRNKSISLREIVVITGNL
jgi:hypothetical protein